MKKLMLSALGLLTVVNALGQTSTAAGGTITKLGSGWNADQIGIFMSVPIPNPAGCPLNDQILLTASTPGYKMHVALALTAYTQNKSFVVVVSNSVCSPHGRPALIGTSME